MEREIYKDRIDGIRAGIEHTAHALNDGGAAVTVATVGIVSAIPEGLGLYLTGANHISSAFAGVMAFALPCVSVGAVYVAVTKRSFPMWFVFFGQLGISLMLTVQLGASWEWMLPIATGLGAIVAAVGQSHRTEQRKEDDAKAWEREQQALDRETARKVKLAKVVGQSGGHSADKMSGQNVHKVSKEERAKQLSSEGITPAEIAEQLGVTDRTVRRYLKNVRKMSGQNVHLNGKGQVAHG